jgi:hypothetical protein
MKEKTQVFFVHGGDTFRRRKDYLQWLQNRKVSLDEKKSWKDDCINKLGINFDFIRPEMPCKNNARYDDWKIYFEKFIPLLKDQVIFIGTSLGGIFLAKYLSENKFPRKILATYLVAAPYDNNLPDEGLFGGFKLPSDLSLFEKNSSKTRLIFAEDDPVVSLEHLQKYVKKLPHAKVSVLKNKGHFRVKKLPEVIKMLQQDLQVLKKK